MTIAEGQRYSWLTSTVRIMHVVESPRHGAWAYIETTFHNGVVRRKYQKLPLPAEAKLLAGAR